MSAAEPDGQGPEFGQGDIPLSQSAFRRILPAHPVPAAAFVSARTDELWLERNAISSAVASGGMIPLVFDAALNKLADEVFPQQAREESQARLTRSGRSGHKLQPRTSGKRTLRDQVDSLVDAADFFVGVYYRTSGLQEYSTGWLTWVEYEFYRFLFRQLCLEGHGLAEMDGPTARFHPWRPLSTDELRRLNNLVRSKERLEWMRTQLQRTAHGNGDRDSRRMACVLRTRTLLFHKRTRDGDPRLAYDLQEFLLPLRGYLREVRTTLREAPGEHQNRGDYHYFPAHARLFQAVRSSLQQLTSGNPGQRSEVCLRVNVRRRESIQNAPGILYPILREIFQRGLSIRAAYVACAPDSASGEGITCYATSSRPGWDPRAEQQHLQQRLAVLFPETSHVIPDVQVQATRSLEESLEPGPTRPGSDTIQLLDSPGALWSVSTLIASYGGSIEYLRLDPPGPPLDKAPAQGPSPHGELLIEFTLGSQPPGGQIPFETEEHDRPTFDYQLRSLHGVLAVR